ncbi:hypothetical protein HRbin02_00391 [Candidatus Calditenuaceae archaeon HR02]|nr:hypothetical protein HRbin02_00391 [Candidatus Calditenuaceae archaeon HR02]
MTAIITLGAYTVLGLALAPIDGREGFALIPRDVASFFPHIIAVINLSTVVLLQLGYRSIRGKRISLHAVFMGASFTLIVAFLVLYVLKVATLGPEAYKGPEILRNLVYLPALTIHLTLSIISVPLVVYNALTGLWLRAQAGISHHRRVGRIAYPAWTVSLVLGLLVYAMLRLPIGGG